LYQESKKMNSLLIKNCTVIGENDIYPDRDVFCENGKIAKITDSGEINHKDNSNAIDAEGMYLVPGFIDLHIHGLKSLLVDNGVDDLEKICSELPRYGVTAFLPTVSPLPEGKDAQFLEKLSKIESLGPQILGFHLEGPFLAVTGALPRDAIGKADPKRAEKLINSCKPFNAVFSISPEIDNICEVIKLASNNSCPVFITHTKADVKQTQSAIKAGARHATHFYDVFYAPEMTDPGVRPCGAVEAILADDRVSVDFILDGEHVDPVAVKMALNCKGEDKVCLITDANIGAANKPGKYKFGGQEIEFAYPGSPARLVKNNSLAGSGLTMIKAVKNAVKMLDIDLPLAVKMASYNPARVVGLEKSKGKIKEGFDADMILLDKNLDVNKCWIKNKCWFEQ
jgi:N-acetylglucosamine-6-phosphate deacetylase